VTLPPELLDRLRRPRPQPPPPREGDPPLLEEESRTKQEPPPPPPPERRAKGKREPRPGQEQIFLVIPKSRPGYWVGVRLPARAAERPEPVPAVLLIYSSSIFANNLLFDWILWAVIPLGVVFVSALCWMPFVRGLTRSVAQMSRVTGRMALGQFDVRVEEVRRDELGQLGSEINDLASRLASFVNNQKRFLGDIAHELSAPLARIQFALGILEQKAEQSPQVQVAALREEIQEMSSLVNELLSFSKAGMDPAGVPLAPLKLSAIVEKAVARESGQIAVTVDPQLEVLANEAYLMRAISNLLRNAVRYAGGAGPIEVSARREKDIVQIVVADSGPGVAEDSLDQLFVPFYRPESSRARDSGGAGLGLAIVRSCVEACKGTVACRNRKPTGLEVTITLQSARVA
jgi:two-component system sensor histidine kinase CpxA